MHYTDFSWRSPDQTKMIGRVWIPIIPSKAVIALVHGMGEHSGRYKKLAAFFTEQGYAVIAFDQRGHGKSEGKRGHVSNYSVLIDGIDELLDKAFIQFKDKPIFLYGHSMGGNLVLNYILRKPFKVKGAIVTAPWLKLAFEPSPIIVKLARIMRNVWPGFSQSSGLNTKHLSRDSDIIKAYERDRYVHDKISSSFYMGVYEAGLYALRHAAELKTPLLLMHGTEDKITSETASRRFAESSKLLTEYKDWEGFYHEIHNEPEKMEVFQHTLQWLNNQLK